MLVKTFLALTLFCMMELFSFGCGQTRFGMEPGEKNEVVIKLPSVPASFSPDPLQFSN